LYDAQDEALVVADHLVERGEVGKVFGHKAI
jgi:hypothetical protein